MSTVKFLAIGLEKSCLEICLKTCPKAVVTELTNELKIVAETPFDHSSAFIVCGPPPEGVSALEFVKALTLQRVECPIFYLTTSRSGFERKALHKNGFTDGFLLPMDSAVLDSALKDAISLATQGVVKSYKSVKMIDIRGGEVLDFDTFIHLPVNNKHLKFSAAGDLLDQERADRLKQKHLSSLKVPHDQMPLFYSFTAKQLRKLDGSTGLSETEKRDKMQTAVRDIIGGLFDDSNKTADSQQGKAVVSDCQQIVKAFILTGDGDPKAKSWYEKVVSISDTGADTYSHASNVATFGAMFSLGLGLGKPEDVAIAAILHDIGLADVPLYIQSKEQGDRTEAEEIAYRMHTEHSLKLIRDRKIVVSAPVLQAIEQHHERFDGAGYPKGLAGEAICAEAQLLALADEFDYLISGARAGVKLTPVQALERLIEFNAVEPRFEPSLLAKLAALFPSAQTDAQTAEAA